jgi:hypothetical protein
VKKKMVVVNDHKEICILFLPLFFFFCFKRPWNVFEMEIYTNHSRLPDGWITIVVVVYFCCFFSRFWNFSLLPTTDSKYTRVCEVKETEFPKTHTVYQKVMNSKCSSSKKLFWAAGNEQWGKWRRSEERGRGRTHTRTDRYLTLDWIRLTQSQLLL